MGQRLTKRDGTRARKARDGGAGRACAGAPSLRGTPDARARGSQYRRASLPRATPPPERSPGKLPRRARGALVILLHPARRVVDAPHAHAR
jgi:hypothetical protein